MAASTAPTEYSRNSNSGVRGDIPSDSPARPPFLVSARGHPPRPRPMTIRGHFSPKSTPLPPLLQEDCPTLQSQPVEGQRALRAGRRFRASLLGVRSLGNRAVQSMISSWQTVEAAGELLPGFAFQRAREVHQALQLGRQIVGEAGADPGPAQD